MREQCTVSSSFATDKVLQDIWSCQKHPWRHLIHTKTKRSLICDPVKNIHLENPKSLWVQIVCNIYLHFWLTELIYKKYYVLLVQQLCCGYIANNDPSCFGSLADNGRSVRIDGSVFESYRRVGVILAMHTTGESYNERNAQRTTGLGRDLLMYGVLICR